MQTLQMSCIIQNVSGNPMEFNVLNTARKLMTGIGRLESKDGMELGGEAYHDIAISRNEPMARNPNVHPKGIVEELRPLTNAHAK
jgi:hypothetical protein